MSGATLGILIILIGIGVGIYTMYNSTKFREIMWAIWDSFYTISKSLFHKTWFRAVFAGGLIFLGGWLTIASMVSGG